MSIHRPIGRGLLAAVVSLTVAWSVSLPGVARAQMMSGVPLTPAIVEAFIASYPSVNATGEELNQQYGGTASGGDDPASAYQGLLAYTAATGAMNSAVQAYGFADFQSWLQVLTSVATAYAFLGEEGQGMDSQMAEAMAGIQSNPNLTAAQQQMMMQQLQLSMGMIAAMAPPQENIDAVAPYADQLAALFDDD